LFEEYSLLSQLSYDLYTVPEDKEEHVNQLAENLLTSKKPQKLLKRVYEMPVVESYDTKHIKKLLEIFQYETCKIMLVGNEILENEDV
jgi:hypothetical protein